MGRKVVTPPGYDPDVGVTMLGRGLYDAAETARLLGHDTGWVVRWSTPSRSRAPVVVPSFGRMFSFEDLVGLRVAMLVRDQGVSDAHLRQGVDRLRALTGLDRPLASRPAIESLAVSGRAFLSDWSGEFEDIGQGGQGVFDEIVRIQLSRVKFDPRGEPDRWVPWDGVVIDPAIQAGAPCIAGTRVLTATIAGLALDSDLEDLALDFDVSPEAVRAAVAFERSLADGAGLAA